MPPIQITAFPNTGHRYHFESLEDVIMGMPELEDICEQNLSGWEEGVLPPKEGQTEPQRCHWIRYRYGKKGAIYGVWIAIETNVGGITRGSVYTVDQPVPAEDGAQMLADSHSPYPFPDIAAAMNNADRRGIYQFKFSITDPNDPKRILHTLELDVIWLKPSGTAIDVDLMVDFGNTRTTVLALENTAGVGFSTLCRSILFMPRGYEYPTVQEMQDDPDTYAPIVDSWFILQEPNFAEWDFPPGETGQQSAGKFYLSKEVQKNTIDNPAYHPLWNRNVPKTLDEYHVTERIPQMFVELSPAMMGFDASNSYCQIENLSQGLNVSMSSPKRYLWDTERRIANQGAGDGAGVAMWHMQTNSWSRFTAKNALNTLKGQICRFMYDDGRDWRSPEQQKAGEDAIKYPPYEANPTERPSFVPQEPYYPRSCAMVWSALHIIENAYRQISSENWRTSQGNPFIRRRLRSVNVTYPSGWITEEYESYRRAWQQALDIFTLSQLDNHEYLPWNDHTTAVGRPKLYMEVDEAVASQLPFVYSEIQRMQGNADLWLMLYGRPSSIELPPRPSSGSNRVAAVRREDAVAAQQAPTQYEYHARVMTIDIGGGTCDTSIVEYRNGMNAGTALRYNTLFRDCSTTAGDAVIQKLIEKILLPAMLEVRGVDPDTESGREIWRRFRSLMGARRTGGDHPVWQRIVSRVFLPVIRQWLTDMNTCPRRYYVDELRDVSFRSFEECGVDPTVLQDFNQFLYRDGVVRTPDFLYADDRLTYDPKEIDKWIREVLKRAIAPLSRFIAAYGVDVVTVSGKISEMDVVQSLLTEHLPICPQRIVRMKNYCAGGWYPASLSDGDLIRDAKSVTAVGTALFFASRHGHGQGNVNVNWISRDDQAAKYRHRNFWGTIAQRGFGKILLEPEADDNKNNKDTSDHREFSGHVVQLGDYIGRAKHEAAAPEQQYRITWYGGEDSPRHPLAIVVARCGNAQGDDNIKLVSVTHTHPDDRECGVSLDTVRLRFRTLPDRGFWMEECVFDM